MKRTDAVFRLFLNVQMDRSVDNNDTIRMDAVGISIDGQEFRLKFKTGRAVPAGGACPDTVYITLTDPDGGFGDAGKITKDLLSSAGKITDFWTSPVGGGIHPVKLLSCRFEFPAEDFRKFFLPDCPVREAGSWDGEYRIVTDGVEDPDEWRVSYTVQVGEDRFVDVMCIREFLPDAKDYEYIMDNPGGLEVYDSAGNEYDILFDQGKCFQLAREQYAKDYPEPVEER